MFPTDRPGGDVQMELRRVGTRETWDQRYRRKDGGELWALATCCPLHHHGTFVGAIGMFADITERKRLEEALKESERRFRGTFENAAVGMAHVGLDGSWLRVNRQLCDMLGFSHAELMGTTFKDITHPDDLAGDLAQAERVKAGEIDGYTLEKRYRRKNGEFFWGELTVSMLHDEHGRPLHFISVVKDATTRRRAMDELNRRREELQAASQAKDRFLATLSHELRSPLSPVLLLAGEAAQDEQWPAEVRQLFRSIEESVLHEARMIDDLLDVTRIASGRLRLSPAPMELRGLLRSVEAALQSVARPKQVHLAIMVPDDALMVRGDPTRLRQVFHNLIGNAIKFTPPAGRVEVRATRHADGRTVDVVITDTGIGMSAAEQQQLFQRFSQGDHAVDTPHRYGGLGLGLIITKGLVEQHGGTISGRSPGKGGGSIFTVTLPLLDPPASTPPS